MLTTADQSLYTKMQRADPAVFAAASDVLSDAHRFVTLYAFDV